MVEFSLIAWLWPLTGAVLGAVVGSFLAALTVRWPAGRSVLKGRSQCDACGAELGARELVPVFSYFWQRGRCRHCDTAIASDHLAVELGCAFMGAIAFYTAPGVAGGAGALFGRLLLALAVLDIRHLWLPDRLTGLLAMLGLAAAAADPWPVLTDRLIGGAGGFILLWLIGEAFRRLRGREGLGGGDPKLFGAIGCWLGWQMLPLVMLLAATVGLASVIADRLRGRDAGKNRELPLGAFLAVAAFPLWVLTQSLGRDAVSAIAPAAGFG